MSIQVHYVYVPAFVYYSLKKKKKKNLTGRGRGLCF